jgi:hypothetical protein
MGVAFCAYATKSYQHAQAWHGYIVGDWLINYSSGFVRRGLAGTLFVGLSKLTGLPLNYLVSVAHITVSAIFFYNLAMLVTNAPISYWRFFVLTSPAFLLFYILDEGAIGRKEMLLFALFSSWVVILKRSKTFPATGSVVVALAVIAMTLIHELAAFFAIYFVLAVYVRFGNARQAFAAALPIPLAGVLTLLLVLLWGGQINHSQMCDIILQQGADEHVCSGIMKVPPVDVLSALNGLGNWFGYQHFIRLTLSALLGFLPVVMLFDMKQKRTIRAVSLFYALAFMLSLPLYITAIDWGRWTHIHFVLLTLSLFLASDGSDSAEYARKMRVRRNGAVVAAGVLLLSSGFWKLTHCCSGGFIQMEGSLAQPLVNYIMPFFASAS